MYHSKLPTLILHMLLISYQSLTRLHYCLVLLAPILILAIDFVSLNPTIWCCLWSKLNIVLLIFYLFFLQSLVFVILLFQIVLQHVPLHLLLYCLYLQLHIGFLLMFIDKIHICILLICFFFLFINSTMKKWGDLQLGFWVAMTICNSLQLDVFLRAWMLSNKLHELQQM